VLLSHSSVASDQSRSADATRLLDRARALAARSDDAELRANIDSRVGQVLQREGRWQELAELHQAALQRARAAHGEEHESVGLARFGLAVATSNLGRRREAADTMESALALLDRIFPEGNQRVQNMLPLAVSVFDRAGRSDAALAIARRNLDAARAMYGQRNLQTGTALATVGRMLLVRGEVDAAHTHTRDALAIYLDALGPDSDFVAIARHYLANVLSAADRHAEALEQREQARAIAARVDGEESLLHARVLSGLGTDLLHLARHSDAVDAHRRAVALFEQHGDRSGQLEQARLGLAEALLARDAGAAAAEQLDRVARFVAADPELPVLMRRHLALVQAELACVTPDAECAAAMQHLRALFERPEDESLPARQRRLRRLGLDP
jgi:tetratricopeptide (TPR) repeat protein